MLPLPEFHTQHILVFVQTFLNHKDVRDAVDISDFQNYFSENNLAGPHDHSTRNSSTRNSDLHVLRTRIFRGQRYLANINYKVVFS